MRTREEILKEMNGVTRFPMDVLILEVLLDIRDLVDKREPQIKLKESLEHISDLLNEKIS